MADTPGAQPSAPPAPPPETVTASRRHLTIRYALGVDRLLWETEKRTMPDMDAVRAVVSASADSPPPDALDFAAALVTIQAMRLELDALEADALDAAQQAGVSAEAVAAALELPDAASAAARHEMLIARRNAPRAGAQQGTQEDPQSAARAAASADPESASAAQAAADLAFGAETRQERLQVASTHASEARLNARDSAERVALGLLRAADALDRCAVRCREWADSVPGQEERARQQQRATEYLRAASTYREMAATYRNIGRHLP